MNGKLVFLTDLILVPLFVLTFYTGLELHVAGHILNHSLWHDWAVFHSLVSVLFMIVIGVHIHAHRRWYEGMKNKSIKRKSKVTALLSNAFMIVVITGLWLLVGINGSNSSIGQLHYIIGIISSILGFVHLFKRWKILCKGVRFAFMKKADSVR